jgi:hypothetical protein
MFCGLPPLFLSLNLARVTSAVGRDELHRIESVMIASLGARASLPSPSIMKQTVTHARHLPRPHTSQRHLALSTSQSQALDAHTPGSIHVNRCFLGSRGATTGGTGTNSR